MNHNLLPKHGVAMTFDCNNRQMLDELQRIFSMQRQASIELGMLFAEHDNLVIKMPCKQCLLDVALQLHDLSEAIRELIGK